MGKSALRRIPGSSAAGSPLQRPRCGSSSILAPSRSLSTAQQLVGWRDEPHRTGPVLARLPQDLYANIFTTFVIGMNSYDGNMWTMLPLLRESLSVYLFILATSHIKQRYRMLLSLAALLHSYSNGRW